MTSRSLPSLKRNARDSDDPKEVQNDGGSAQQSKKRRVRGRKGALEGLPELPCDILFEIFGHLKPKDIVSLSRTGTILRNNLLAEAWTHVWIAARENCPGLPECPDDLSEPEYARLMFHTTCHICQKPNANKYIWSVPARLCNGCLDDYGYFMDDRGFSIHLPNFYNNSISKAWSEICNVVPSHRWIITRQPSGGRRWYIEQAKRYLAEYLSIKDQASRRKWIKNKAAALENRIEHGHRCEEYLSGEHWQHYNQKREAKFARKEELVHTFTIELHTDRELSRIEKKLRGIGYSDVFDSWHQHRRWDFNKHKCVDQPRELTERIWNGIKPEMIKFMEECRKEIRYKEGEALLSLELLSTGGQSSSKE